MAETEEYKERIRNRVLQFRSDKNWSQQELADYANVSKKTVQRIESAKMNPSIETLNSLAKTFGVELEELLRSIE